MSSVIEKGLPASAGNAAAKGRSEEAAPAAATIDGFHLVIEALKLNDIDTDLRPAGHPDHRPDAHGAGRGHARDLVPPRAARRQRRRRGRLPDAKPGICLTVSAPGFLNGLTALANATTNCFPMILISGSSEREIVDLQQGDYEEMDQLAIAKPLCKAAYRVLHAEDIGVGIARAIRCGGVGPSRRRLPRLAGQAVLAGDGCRRRQASLIKVVDPAPRQLPAPDAVAARARRAEGRQAAADHARQGRGLCAGRRRHPRPGREDRHPLPADVDGQGPAARHARAVGGGDALVRAGRGRRRDADRRAPQLAALARQGQDLGRRQRRRSKFIQIDISPTEIDSNVPIAAPLVGDIGSCVAALRRAASARNWAKPPAEWTGAIAERKDKNLAKMAETLAKSPSPMSFQSALSVIRDVGQGATRRRSSSTKAPTRSTSRARSSTCTSRASASTSAPGESWASAWASPSPPR